MSALRTSLLPAALLASVAAACGDLPFVDDDRSASSDVVQLSAASRHACARLRDGLVYCWGDNSGGRLGTNDEAAYFEPVRVDLPGHASFVDASEGGGCAIVARELYCWGTDDPGTYGDAGEEDTVLRVEQTAPGHRWRAVSGPLLGFDRHRCALDVDGRAFCWGSNYSGQLGDSSRLDRAVPTAVHGDLRWRSISAGSLITCGVADDRRGYCWGNNFDGELGIGVEDPYYTGMRSSRTFPHELAGGHRWLEIAAMSGGACGLTVEGEAYCWGYSVEPPVGLADGIPRHTPRPIGLAGNDLGARLGHVCVASGTGTVACWGSNEAGQLGTGDFSPAPSPALVASEAAYLDVAAGSGFTCAITRGHAVDCWGANGYLQLADGTAQDRPAPVRVPLN